MLYLHGKYAKYHNAILNQLESCQTYKNKLILLLILLHVININ